MRCIGKIIRHISVKIDESGLIGREKDRIEKSVLLVSILIMKWLSVYA